MGAAHCPCCSGKLFRQCCEPLLSGRASARTVKQLMRSRYCAFALGGHGDYLLQTWHPSTAPRLSAAELDQDGLDWLRLEVLRSEQSGSTGVVEFKAWFADDPNETGEQLHHEVSGFVRERGRWLYLRAL